eukprot:2603498-Amphidinium_carterae.1
MSLCEADNRTPAKHHRGKPFLESTQVSRQGSLWTIPFNLESDADMIAMVCNLYITVRPSSFKALGIWGGHGTARWSTVKQLTNCQGLHTE